MGINLPNETKGDLHRDTPEMLLPRGTDSGLFASSLGELPWMDGVNVWGMGSELVGWVLEEVLATE